MTTREPISDAKAREFLLPSSAGAPTITDAAAKERSPELWVTLLIQGILAGKFQKMGVSGLGDV